MVLLKNANHTLPLKTSLGTIAVMGPNCNNITMQYGNYNGKAPPEHQVTILDGIKRVVGADHVLTLTTQAPIAGNAPNEALNAEAADLARKADAVVLVVGISGRQEGEMRDRNAIELPAVQQSLIESAAAAAGNKPVIVVNCSGSAIALNWEDANIPAVIQAWYPGQRGDAVADVLFGKYNPAGRLPVTFYKATADLPAFTDYAMYNRTYRYNMEPVLYPFGHGLSYSTFEYSNLAVPDQSASDDDVRVSCTIRNTSAIDGDEVVQCYLNRDLPPVDSRQPACTRQDERRAGHAARHAAQDPRGLCAGAAEGGPEQKRHVYDHHTTALAGRRQGWQARSPSRDTSGSDRRQFGDWPRNPDAEIHFGGATQTAAISFCRAGGEVIEGNAPSRGCLEVRFDWYCSTICRATSANSRAM